MHPTIPSFIQLAGALQLLTAAANFFLPSKLQYRENLAKVSPIIRQIFIVHALYIVLVLMGFGTICLIFPDDLGGSSRLGKFLCAFLSIFWGSRAVIQLTCYDRDVKKAHPMGAWFFAVLFSYLAATFMAATLFGN